MVTKDQVLKVQDLWGKAIVEIGTVAQDEKLRTARAQQCLDELYAYNQGPVLFKPTKVTEKSFRGNNEGALSYFVGSNSHYPEDLGFALNPWTQVEFENNELILEAERALAMGHYYFTTTTGEKVKVEYSFGYKLVGKELRIDLHHSSLPYKA